MSITARTLSGFFASAVIVAGGMGVSQNAEARDPTVGEVIVGGVILHQIAKGNITIDVRRHHERAHGRHYDHRHDNHRGRAHIGRYDYHGYHNDRSHWDIRIVPVQPVFPLPQNYVYVTPPPIVIPQVQTPNPLSYQDFLIGQQTLCRQTFNVEARSGKTYAGANYDVCMENAPQKAITLWNNYVFGRP